MRIGIINSGGYNINSIKFALNRLEIWDISLITNSNEIIGCDKIILPGVGHARNAIDMLQKQRLIKTIQEYTKPILGICLGMQILFEHSEEGNTECLGIMEGKVINLPDSIIKPQMGWNKLVDGKYSGEFVYFANSYYYPAGNSTTSYVNYCGTKVSATIRKNNIFGCQFHPEKSGKTGERILCDFLYESK